MKRNGQALPPCLSMLLQKLLKFCLELLATTRVTDGIVMLWAWLCCEISWLPFRYFANGFYSAACIWEHGTTASSAGLLVKIANESPRHHFICWVHVLSHKNVDASEASNSRLVYLNFVWTCIYYCSCRQLRKKTLSTCPKYYLP